MRKRWHVLAELVEEFGFRLGAEIGVNNGRNIRETIALCPRLEWIAIDPWTGRYPGEKGTWTEDMHRRHEANFDALHKQFPQRIVKMKMTGAEAAPQIADGSLDLVFIDAIHTEEACADDIATWFLKVRAGGVVAGHDYHHPNFPGVTVAVDKAFGGAVTSDADHVWWLRKP